MHGSESAARHRSPYMPTLSYYDELEELRAKLRESGRPGLADELLHAERGGATSSEVLVATGGTLRRWLRTGDAAAVGLADEIERLERLATDLFHSSNPTFASASRQIWPRDRLRLDMAPVPPESGSGFQIKVFVNEVEMTSAGAGLGMDPYDVLVPDNKFLPVDEPRTFGIARCDCGVYGCDATDITVRRIGDAVTWEWNLHKPISHPSTFAVDEYMDEITRFANDHSWEPPERTAGRLIFGRVDYEHLRRLRVRLDWLNNDWRNPELFEISLRYDAGYQIFGRFPWDRDSAEAMAARIVATLNSPDAPTNWRDGWSWHGMDPAHRETPPDIAHSSWAREKIGAQ